MIETTDLDGVTLVRLNRPPVNALNTELNQAIAATFATLSGPIVLTGTQQCFSAGVDLHAVLDGGRDYTQQFLASLVDAFLAIFDYPGPVVAAVNGHALAGGCVLAMAADMRLMSAGTIGITEIAVGVPFPVSAIEICRHVRGSSATVAALGGEPVHRDDAQRLGWVDELTAADDLLEVAAARARTLGALSPAAFAFTKQQLHRPARTAIAAGTAEDVQVADSWSSAATRARIAEFVETRLRQ
jgi:enoyl-CoA hydratase